MDIFIDYDKDFDKWIPLDVCPGYYLKIDAASLGHAYLVIRHINEIKAFFSDENGNLDPEDFIDGEFPG